MTVSVGQDRSAAGEPATVGALVMVRGVNVTYATSRGPVRALMDVSLSVEPGSSLAIVGPSGCGKSTLLGVLGGLELPTAGDVQVGACLVSAMTDKGRASLRRRAFGFVFQADNLQPFLTVAENVGMQSVLAGLAHDPKRTRKLLLNKREIADLAEATDKDALSLIPLSIYFTNGKAKVELAIARGRKRYDKRQALAERDSKLEMSRALAAANKYRHA